MKGGGIRTEVVGNCTIEAGTADGKVRFVVRGPDADLQRLESILAELGYTVERDPARKTLYAETEA